MTYKEATYMEEKITLEKLDILRERGDLSYQEAKELLELCDGDVIAALIELEHRPKTSKTDAMFTCFSGKTQDVLEKAKQLIQEGKVTRIRISHEGKVLTELPIAVGAISAVLLPQLTLIAAIVAMFRRCTIELVKKDSDDAAEEIIAKLETEEEENHPLS